MSKGQKQSNCKKSNELVNKKLKNGPLYVTLPGAEKAKVESRTNVAEPSDASVDRMRHFSIENRL